MGLKFQNVFSDIQSKIFNGTWIYGEKIPSEMELCDIYGVSRITVRRALDKLVGQGLIVRTRGKGSFVCHRMLIAGASHRWFDERLKETGNPSYVRKLIHKEKVPATGNLARVLNLDGHEEPRMLWYFKGIGYLGDRPVDIRNSYMLESIGDQLIEKGALDAFYQEEIGRIVGKEYVASHGTLSAINANEEIGSLLDIPVGTACIWSRCVGCVEGDVPVEACHTIYNGNLFELLFDVDPRGPVGEFWESFR
ncbi:MAG: GntR family transcriptional regulator [Sphaerochaetaceae bacterium]